MSNVPRRKAVEDLVNQYAALNDRDKQTAYLAVGEAYENSFIDGAKFGRFSQGDRVRLSVTGHLRADSSYMRIRWILDSDAGAEYYLGDEDVDNLRRVKS